MCKSDLTSLAVPPRRIAAPPPPALSFFIPLPSPPRSISITSSSLRLSVRRVAWHRRYGNRRSIALFLGANREIGSYFICRGRHLLAPSTFVPFSRQSHGGLSANPRTRPDLLIADRAFFPSTIFMIRSPPCPLFPRRSFPPLLLLLHHRIHPG